MKVVWVLSAVVLFAGCRREDAPTMLEEAHAALFAQKPEEALLRYKRAIDLLDRDTSPEATVYRARALRGAADVYAFQLGDPKRAVEVYRELISLCPEAPETLEGRLHLAALLRHRFRDLRGAIAELTAALARNPPQSAELSYQVAGMYFELQDYEQCELEAQKLAQRYETSAFVDDALLLRAQALSMMDGRKGDAQRAFVELIERFSDSPLRAHALFELGRLKADAGESERAIELWVQALKTHPEPAVVQDSIARVRSRLRATTPQKVGDAATAFDRDKRPLASAEGAPVKPAKTSAEAVGGTAEEAAQEAQMPAEHAAPHQAMPSAPAAPVKEPPAQGEGSL